MLPMQEINEWIWPMENTCEVLSYDEAIEKNKFEVTYREVNPLNNLLSECECALLAQENEDRIKLIAELRSNGGN